MVINGVNFDILCSYLKEYFVNHNELENYQIVSIIMQLIDNTFTI